MTAFVVLVWAPGAAGEPYADRFVWVFGWSLSRDSDVTEVTRVLETAARHGMNGAVASFGLDTLCKKDDAYFRRLDQIRAACERNRLELIPAIFSVGYGGAALSHDRSLAAGLPVEDALFAVKDGRARLVPEGSVRIENAGFEEFSGHRAQGYGFHDQPGEVSFVDTEVFHLLNMDEVRMGGTCAACRGRDMGELLGECITKQVEALRRHLPEVQVYIWSDMLDPNHNAHGDYYLVEGKSLGVVSREGLAKMKRVAGRPQDLADLSQLGFESAGEEHP